VQWHSISGVVETSGFTKHPPQSVTIQIASHIKEFDTTLPQQLAFKLEYFNPKYLE